MRHFRDAPCDSIAEFTRMTDTTSTATHHHEDSSYFSAFDATDLS
jgi:hypothetical protein